MRWLALPRLSGKAPPLQEAGGTRGPNSWLSQLFFFARFYKLPAPGAPGFSLLPPALGRGKVNIPWAQPPHPTAPPPPPHLPFGALECEGVAAGPSPLPRGYEPHTAVFSLPLPPGPLRGRRGALRGDSAQRERHRLNTLQPGVGLLLCYQEFRG